MCSNNQLYAANTGSVVIDTANTNRDGSGSMGTLMTGASDGTIVNSITIKAITSTDQGMIRLFIDNGSVRLFKEIPVPATTPTEIVQSLEINVVGNFNLASGNILKVSTDKADTFAVTASGLDWTNCQCPA